MAYDVEGALEALTAPTIKWKGEEIQLTYPTVRERLVVSKLEKETDWNDEESMLAYLTAISKLVGFPYADQLLDLPEAIAGEVLAFFSATAQGVDSTTLELTLSNSPSEG